MNRFLFIAITSVIYFPSANAQISDVPHVDVYVEEVLVAGTKRSFGYAFLDDGIVLMFKGNPSNPVVVGAGTYVVKPINATTSSVQFAWPDGSVEYSQFEMKANGKIRYSIRKHSDVRQRGLTTTLSTHRVTGQPAENLLMFREATLKALKRQQHSQPNTSRRLLDAHERLKKTLEDESFKRLEIVTSP